MLRRECPWILRERFNAAQFVERWQRGEITRAVIDSGRPSKESHQPQGTFSRSYEFRTPDGRLLAVAHRFVHPQPPQSKYDPKVLFDGSDTLRPIRTQPQERDGGKGTCQHCPEPMPGA